MEIQIVERIQGYYITTVKDDKNFYNEYFRFPSGDWFITMGESLEPVFTKQEELEEKFQKYLKENACE